MRLPLWVIHDRYRTSPVSLPAHKPIAQAILRLLLSVYMLHDVPFRLFTFSSRKWARVGKSPESGIRARISKKPTQGMLVRVGREKLPELVGCQPERLVLSLFRFSNGFFCVALQLKIHNVCVRVSICFLRHVIELTVHDTEVLYELRVGIPYLLFEFSFGCGFWCLPLLNAARDERTPCNLLPFERDVLFFTPMLDDSNNGLAVVKRFSFADFSRLRCLLVCRLNNLSDRQSKFLRKFVIPLVVCWHRHHRTSAVRAEDVIGNVDGDLFFRCGIDCLHSLDFNAGFLFILAPFPLCLFLGCFSIAPNLFCILCKRQAVSCQLGYGWMFRR